jgi:hypothetical protein
MHRFAKLETGNIDLQNLPFVSEIKPTQDTAEQRVMRLENRIQELEKILKDYVFNPSILKYLKKEDERQLSEKDNYYYAE